MSVLPVIPPGVDASAVQSFALGFLENQFENRPRAMAILAEALTEGIAYARGRADADPLSEGDIEAIDGVMLEPGGPS